MSKSKKQHAVQTRLTGAEEANAAGGRSAEESPSQATPPPASSTPRTQAGSDASVNAWPIQAPPAAFDATAAAWIRCRVHGERGPEVDICRPNHAVYIRSEHGILLCEQGCMIMRYPDRPDELHVVSEHDFGAISYKGRPGVNVVDERAPER